MIDYDGRRFRSIGNSEGGDVDGATVFEYRQRDDVVWATYSGGAVRQGTLVAVMSDDGALDMRYAHAAEDGTLKTGVCVSRPELLADGRVRLHESWRWTSGGEGSGSSVVEEIAPGDRPPGAG